MNIIETIDRLFHKPEPVSTVAALRDELIRTQTANVFLVNELEHARRPKREKRKDAADIKAAKAETTARLQRALSRGATERVSG